MKKNKFYFVAIIALVVFLVQPKVWHGLKDYFTKIDFETQLGLKSDVESNRSNSQLLELDLKGKKQIEVAKHSGFTQTELEKSKHSWIKFSGVTATGKLKEVNLVVTPKSLNNDKNSEKELKDIRPLGWHDKQRKLAKIPIVSPNLINFTLDKNRVFTGTKQTAETLNQVMNKVYESVLTSGQPARVRVTPIYKIVSQIPSGLIIESRGIGTDPLDFKIYVINQQKGYRLNYLTGKLTEER
ncbi:DNA-entry nuclease [Ligilactobacillus agilis]|uniref:DNA-entry nuclease n=1 Tax=Ligilactobacillus agilis TaxID=1601 RepID=A0A6F9Y1M1_9LACO|nr:hypothetical protein [Ligilactobacillus agilis]GET06170.1 DNA-entry nuclease [Ligilactobacillus agilis]GET07444.1 DNA-entry nuclease [Ligilactobacillus agilis]GET11240.1 DNA-entry nuclease [Ligilactobacillus agilis]